MSSRDAVESSMNVLATVLFAIRERIFFCALRPMSRALKVSWVSVMTGRVVVDRRVLLLIRRTGWPQGNNRNTDWLTMSTRQRQSTDDIVMWCSELAGDRSGLVRYVGGLSGLSMNGDTCSCM